MQKTLTATFPLLAAVLLWGSSFIALKTAMDAFHPMVVILARLVIASAVFLLLWPRIRPPKIERRDVPAILGMALFEPCLYFIFEGYAISYTTASQAGMITAILPLLVAVAARFVLGERTSPRTLFGFALSISGVVWLSAAAVDTEHAPNPALGNLLEFAAMCCATGYVISAKKLTAKYNSWFLTAVQAFAGAVFFTPFLALPGVPVPQVFPAIPTACLFYLGVVVSIGAYGLYNLGVSRVTANQSSVFINLIPVTAVVLGWLLLGETFTGQQMLASVLVFAGVFLSQDSSRRKRERIVK
ncbi:DMT family transporter [Desulfohalovibrio reitneri]|uniref:DMT family transporter n=1 Tax=Desulfohalovibrio reitneri TaxID=1307759 RepID=UPI0005587C51|nr:DMT family transporter [Desulfohalovibrio reitneri]